MICDSGLSGNCMVTTIWNTQMIVTRELIKMKDEVQQIEWR
jgi:hypothetical protein